MKVKKNFKIDEDFTPKQRHKAIKEDFKILDKSLTADDLLMLFNSLKGTDIQGEVIKCDVEAFGDYNTIFSITIIVYNIHVEINVIEFMITYKNNEFIESKSPLLSSIYRYGFDRYGK